MKHNSKLLILIAEDNRDHANLLVMELKDIGISEKNILVVRDGREALNFLLNQEGRNSQEKQLPSVILLDLKMPRINGFEFLKTMREEDDLEKIPVIVLTTTMNELERSKASELGAYDYIVKPAAPELLANKLKDLINKKR